MGAAAGGQGAPGAPGSPLQYATPYDFQPGYVNYCGFWWRVLSYFIDSILVGIPFRIVGVVLEQTVNDEETLLILALALSLVQIVTFWLYDAMRTSSSYRGTLGKHWLGIRVLDLNGQPVSFGRATGRYFGKMLSGLICGIGFLMVAWDERKQGLHDKMAGTIVIKE